MQHDVTIKGSGPPPEAAVAAVVKGKRVEIEGSPPLKWEVFCACGWTSPHSPFRWYRDADNEATEHILAMARVEDPT